MATLLQQNVPEIGTNIEEKRKILILGIIQMSGL